MPLHFSVQDGRPGGLLDRPTQGRPEGFGQFRCCQKGGDCRHHIGVSGAGIKKSAECAAIDLDVFPNPSHRCPCKKEILLLPVVIIETVVASASSAAATRCSAWRRGRGHTAR